MAVAIDHLDSVVLAVVIELIELAGGIGLFDQPVETVVLVGGGVIVWVGTRDEIADAVIGHPRDVAQGRGGGDHRTVTGRIIGIGGGVAALVGCGDNVAVGVVGPPANLEK